MSKLIYR